MCIPSKYPGGTGGGRLGCLGSRGAGPIGACGATLIGGALGPTANSLGPTGLGPNTLGVCVEAGMSASWSGSCSGVVLGAVKDGLAGGTAASHSLAVEWTR